VTPDILTGRKHIEVCGDYVCVPIRPFQRMSTSRTKSLTYSLTLIVDLRPDTVSRARGAHAVEFIDSLRRYRCTHCDLLAGSPDAVLGQL
jgi:hypothetical protein